MRRLLVVLLCLILAAGGAALAGRAVIIRSATGADPGPMLSIGTPSLVDGKLAVPIVASGTGFNAYASARLDLQWDPAVFTLASVSTAGDVYQNGQCSTTNDGDSSDSFCTLASPTTATGTLITVVLTPIETGCSVFHLVPFVEPTGPGSATTGAGSGHRQQNTFGPDIYVDTAGVACAASPTPTDTLTPTATNTATPTATRSPFPTPVGANGPEIAVGTPSLVNGIVMVPIEARNAVDPYDNYEIHLRWDPRVFALKSSTPGTILAPLFCDPAQIDVDGAGAKVDCAQIPATGSAANGTMLTIGMQPLVSGCSLIHLETFGTPDNGGVPDGTYTSSVLENGLDQHNTYADGASDENGNACTPPATATPTFTPTSTFTASPTDTPTITPTPSGRGADIGIGDTALDSGHVKVPLVTSGDDFDPYTGFDIEVEWDASVFRFGAFDNAGTIVPAANCTTFPQANTLSVHCVGNAPVATTGLLATIDLTPVGVGCSRLDLLFGSTRGTNPFIPERTTLHDGAVDDTGSPCVAAPTPTATATNTPTATATFTASATRTATPTPTITPTSTPFIPPLTRGPDLVVGTPSLADDSIRVPLEASGSGFEAYAGYRLHVRWDAAVFSLSRVDYTGGIAGACATRPLQDPDDGGVDFTCHPTAANTSTGVLATLVLQRVTFGCSAVHFLTFGPPDEGNLETGTYTLNVAGAAQGNTYVDGTTDTNGGACSPPPPTPTPTASPPPSGIQLFNPSICLALSLAVPNGPAGGCLVSGNLAFFSNDSNLKQAANLLGDNDGVIEPADFAQADDLTGSQLHQQDGGAPASDGSLAVLAFVPGSGPVTFSTTAGTFRESGSPSWMCDSNQPAFAVDPDCGGEPSQADHVVVATLSCTLVTCPVRGLQHLTVTQNGIAQTRDFTVVGEPVAVTFDPSPPSLATGAASTQCAGNALSPGVLPPSAARLIAHAVDSNGTFVTSAWLLFSTSNPLEAVVASAIGPSVRLPDGSIGAPVIVCAPAGAVPGAVQVSAQLQRTAQGGLFLPDPSADPDSTDPNALASGSTTLHIIEPQATTSTPTPTDTPTPTPTPFGQVRTVTPTPTDTPVATATATATATDTPASTATEMPTATATNTSVPTATDTATATDTPTATATNTSVPTATETATSTATETPIPTATDTPTPTNTPVPTATDTPTSTATDTPTAAATNTPVPTATDTVTATATSSVPPPCMSLGQKVATSIDILRRFGARAGERRYRARDDVNDDHVIDFDDLLLVIEAPLCHGQRR